MYQAEPGDILLFRQLHTLEVREINLIQRLKDGRQPYFYYHCSIVLDIHTQIESNGKVVEVSALPRGGFDAFRPPIDEDSRKSGIQYIRSLVGQPYDWTLIVDDVLRALTRNLIHLPVRLVTSEERHRKICSSLVVKYLDATGWNHTLTHSALPEDVYFALKNYEVSTDSHLEENMQARHSIVGNNSDIHPLGK